MKKNNRNRANTFTEENCIKKNPAEKYFVFYVIFISVLFILGSNSIPLGHYVDDIKWILLSENFLKLSTACPWTYFKEVELINWGTSILVLLFCPLFQKRIFLKKHAIVM